MPRLSPPTRQENFPGDHPLWFADIRVGLTLLRESGVWSVAQTAITDTRMRLAERVLQGDAWIDEATAAELTAQGFGAYVVATADVIRDPMEESF